MLRKIRIVSQAAFFLLFAGLFFFVNTLSHGYSGAADLFLRLNPLVALLTSMAARTFIISVAITGLVVAVLSVIFGRFFCGFVCPLGSAIDFFDRFLFKKMRSNGRRPPRYLQRLKYALLFGLVLLSLAGAVLPLFMDPISLVTRLFTIVINPFLALTGAKLLAVSSPLLDAIGLDTVRYVTVKTPLFYGTASAAFLLAVIIAGGFWDRRFWCQYVCPSGALFGLLARAPLFRRTHFISQCNSCAACSRICPTRSIDANAIEATNTAECIVCGLCTQIKATCSGFRFSLPARQSITAPDLKRRHAAAGIAGGLLLLPVVKLTAINRADGNGRLLRPPGAMPEPEFLSRCIACGNCMKACPTNTLQPCTTSDGFNRLFTPKIVPRIGACDSKCHLCGYVCPTGAIRRVPIEEKPYARMGTAVVDRHRCLAWTRQKECLVCDESCPFNAIEPRLVETLRGPFKVPVVREDLCTGCGMCELKCPIYDRGAIEVFRFGENRKSHGPWATPAQKKKLEQLRKESDKDLIVGATTTPAMKNDSTVAAKKAPAAESTPSLPPGFTE
ncbi:MAG: 4Fe-4S binding protein [Chitinispirillaceae bacterium]|nr:4Fe-4S binding protein [Chitinispirillaceae bacterium]